MSDGSKVNPVGVAALIGGLLYPTTENNLTPSMNNGDDYLTGKWALARKLDTADVVNHGKNNAQIVKKGCCPKSRFHLNFQ